MKKLKPPNKCPNRRPGIQLPWFDLHRPFGFHYKQNYSNWSYSGIQSLSLLDRGYTGHEHLPQFGLINMNGRLYDPILGRMLSPDNFVQAPVYTQNFNRYSYVLNNPLRYTDPDGEWVVQALMSVGGMYWGGAAANNFQFNPRNWNWRNPMTYLGILKGGVDGYNEGEAMKKDWLDFKSSMPYKFKIDKNPVFYVWGPGDPNNEFNTYIPEEVIVMGARITKMGWLSNMWNSGAARFLVDDLISVDFHLYSTAIGGGGQTWSLNLLTRGQDPGFHLTRTTYKRIGREIDWGFNLNSAHFLDDPTKMNASHIPGPTNSISIGYIVGLDGFVGYDETGARKWIGRGGGLGFGGGISYGWGKTYKAWW